MHCFRYDDLQEAVCGDYAELSGAEKAHVFKILHLSPGEHIGLLDGKGMTALAEVCSERRIRVISKAAVPPPVRGLQLYIAPPRKHKLDILLKQCCELGVSRIVPMISGRSVAVPKAERTSGRWTDVLFEGCKQSGNAYLPVVEEPVAFAEALSMAKRDCPKLFYGSPRTDCAADYGESGDIAFFVGPEGGFDDSEERLLSDSGVQPLRVGCWTLRVETAVVAGIAVLLAKM